jgi:hypothetical protein
LFEKQIPSNLNQGRIIISSIIDFFRKKLKRTLLKVQPLPRGGVTAIKKKLPLPHRHRTTMDIYATKGIFFSFYKY